MAKKLNPLNLTYVVADHLIGKKHTIAHRMGIGGIFMLIGVMISNCFLDYHVLHIFCDGAGYLIHGIGGVPFVERLSQIINQNEV